MPLDNLASLFSQCCISCYFEGRPNHHHRTEDCPHSTDLRGYNPGFKDFRMRFNVPDRCCYGCGRHTGSWSRHTGPLGKTACHDAGVYDRILFYYFMHQDMKPQFDIPGIEGVNGPDEYITWLLTKFQEETTPYWPNEHNGQRRFNYHVLLAYIAVHFLRNGG
jgi:hypothetical protein